MSQSHSYQIKELCNVKRGGSPRPIEKYLIAKDGSGHNWLLIGDIENDADYIEKTGQKISEKGLSKTTLVKAGELILSNSMSFGRPYITKIETCIHDGWLALKDIKHDFINTKYFYYLLKSTAIQKKFNNLSAGSGVKNLKREIVENILIRIPDLETQQKIVQILDTWNTSIKKLKELSEKEKSYFNLQCKLLLSQSNNEAANYKLSDICLYKKGSGLSKELLTSKGLPCILYGELYTHYDYLIDKVYSKAPVTTIGVKSTADDILIPASTTTNGKDLAIASVIKQPDVLLGGDINIFRIKDTNTVDGTFLALYLRYIKWRKMASRAQGITIVHLYGKDLLDLKIELPPLDIQKKIVSIINCQRERINIINDYIIKLEQQYKYLLNHLISGDFDLTNIELENGKEQQ